MPVYYNEIDPFAAQWLRNLILAGHLPRGDVDTRSITEVRPDDLRGYTQYHFFAGIGGWPLGLKLALWPDTRPIWTGSCPCQPFSEAGQGKAFEDSRHLWPSWFRLIRECRPSTIFGEQVEKAIGYGWFDTVANDMEDIGYAVAAAIVPACAVGSKQVRKRVWFLAVSPSEREQFMRREQFKESGNRARSIYPWPSEPSVPCVADDVPNRMDKVRGFGNAIVPPVAAEFIAAYMECEP